MAKKKNKKHKKTVGSKPSKETDESLDLLIAKRYPTMPRDGSDGDCRSDRGGYQKPGIRIFPDPRRYQK